jgi:hypothetical protein
MRERENRDHSELKQGGDQRLQGLETSQRRRNVNRPIDRSQIAPSIHNRRSARDGSQFTSLLVFAG